MKKVLLTFFTIATFAISASAQVSIGAKAGLNFANWGGDAEDTDIRTSIHLGGYLNYAFSENLSIQPELLYNSVGTKYSEDEMDVTNKLNYISVPVMLIYDFGTINVQAGPQLGFLASAKAKYEFDGESETEDIKDAFKGTDFSFNIGLGASFDKLNVSARYSLGLANVIDADEVDVKNNVIQLSVGYRLFGGE